MGSSAAMASINRVLAKHGKELIKEELIAPIGTPLTYRGATIEGNLYDATIIHEFRDPQGKTILVTGRTYDIDEFARRFPNCQVSY